MDVIYGMVVICRIHVPTCKVIAEYNISNVITKANFRVKILYFMGITPTPIPWSFFF